MEEESDDNEVDKNGEALVGVVHLGGQRTITDLISSSLGPNFYHWRDNGRYAQWLRDYPKSEYDVLMKSHHACLSNERLSLRKEIYFLLEPGEVLTKEEWIRGGLRPWVDSVEESDVSLIHVDGTQHKEAIVEAARLEEPLHFKTMSTIIVVGQDVKNYPKVHADWYRNKDERTHVSEADWKYVDVMTKNGKVRQMKMGCKLGENKSRNILIWWMSLASHLLGRMMSLEKSL